MKGQAALEYIMIVAFISLVVIPSTYLFYTYAQRSNEQIKQEQIANFARNVISSAETLYYQGEPSSVVIAGNLPNGVQNIRLLRDWTANPTINELVFDFVDGNETQELVFISDVNMLANFTSVTYSEGRKEIRLKTIEPPGTFPFVILNFGGACWVSDAYDYDLDGNVDATDLAVCESAAAHPIGCFGEEKGYDSWPNCTRCDYNGNCEVDEQDLSFFNMLLES